MDEQLDILNTEVVGKLRGYHGLHHVIFLRTLERVKNPAELFDALDDFPEKFPITWSGENRRWKTVDSVGV